MNETTDATAILAPIWRRKWLILAVGVLVAVGTYIYYKSKPSNFQSTTQVYLAAGAEQQLSEKGAGKNISTSSGDQVAVINSIAVEAARKQLKKAATPAAKVAVHGKVKAKSAEKSEFITITAEAESGRGAALLANTVAVTYIRRQHVNYQRGVYEAIAIARRQLKKLEQPRVTKDKTGGTTVSTTSVIQTASLATKINQLEAQLGVRGVEQVRPAKAVAAVLLGPQPRKNAIFGFVIGLVLAAIAAFALSRFDRRLRSLADVEAVLGAEILTALPLVRTPIVEHGEGSDTTIGRRPSKFLLEPLRRFHTTLSVGKMVEHERQEAPRSILFLSADAGDGKSTVVADLALVQREAGERTLIIEADFRRPVQARLLGLPGPVGLADLLNGSATIEQALQPVPAIVSGGVMSRPPGADGGLATALGAGSVSVLVGDAGVPNPPLLLSSDAMTNLLASATEDYGSVLIDAPSPLEVSDVVPLLAAVDAIVLVARVGHTREASAQRLVQLLMRTPSAPVRGVVANGVARQDMKRYGISSGGSTQGWPAKLFGR
jgi:Mrp family chromosome partitioning ATPase/capsular polysaccharide biosynthesis protein